ncbi:MAG: PEGA domain-containing protein [Lentisphaerae bacterium]|jgi:pSer/pThr/pTyr-binding forkhead associated (FHA) protein|nr:PEGA domain-containing protein [Lentisphaerota bacterium]MBT5609107.1 PEGA domain-containing protein [Lentisphaerota bacterium]MBT7053612.1 PEGA domain-containing protein [Lentisphaerota bacterium]MBT7846937.1 PEGA domain-containing protein [Lentisphaerota bacterium]
MKLRFLGGRYQGRIVDLIPAGFAIGRGKENDLVLDEEGVSRNHCRVYEVAGKWVVEDLESTNGVRINGQRIDSTQTLVSGDRVAIHRELLLFTDGSDIVDTGDLLKGAHRLAEDGDEDGDSPVPAPAPCELTEIDELPKPFEPSSPLPLGRIVLLFALLAFIGWAIHSLRGPAGAEEGEDAEGAPVESVEQPDEEASVPASSGASGLGDDELAALMANDDDDSGEPADSTETGTVFSSTAAQTPVPEVGDVLPETEAGTPAEPTATPPPENAPELAAGGPAVTVVLVMSDPIGATVRVDDTERGVTPLVVRDLAEGRHRIDLAMEGYDPLTRQIHVPDLLPDKPYMLRLKPGMLRVTSSPPGATVWHGTQILGNAPLLLGWLGDGEHALKFSATGYEPVEKTLKVSRIRGETVHAELSPVFGSIEVVTRPAGCQVSIDAAFKAISEPSEDKPGQSEPLLFGGMAERVHLIRVDHPCGSTVQRRIRVVRGEVARVAVKLWVLDTKLTLADGVVKYGMLMERNEHGDVILASSASESDWQRYFSKRVAEVETLSPEAAKEYLASRREKAAPAAEEDDAGKAGPVAFDDDDPAPPPAQEPDDEGGTEPVGKKELRYSAGELRALFKQTSATELNRRVKGHVLVINGVPTAQGPDALGGYLMFGSRVRCFIRQGVYDELKDKIRLAYEAKTPISIRGVAAGIQGGRLVVRDCQVVGKDGGN